MECTWEFDFRYCKHPKTAAEAFVDAVDGCGFSADKSPEIELWASCDEDDLSLVIVGNHGTHLTEEEIHGIIDFQLDDIESKCSEEVPRPDGDLF